MREILAAAVSVIEEICSTGISKSVHIQKHSRNKKIRRFASGHGQGRAGLVLPLGGGEIHFGVEEVAESDNVGRGLERGSGHYGSAGKRQDC